MKWRSKKGFMLPEMMLASAIAAFAICGILLMYIVGMDLVRTSKNASIATNYAQGVMEQIRNTPFKNIPDMVFEVEVNGIKTKYYPVVINANLTRWNFPLPVNIESASSCTVDLDDTDTELFRVTVSVRWRQSNRAVDSTVELVTKVASR